MKNFISVLVGIAISSFTVVEFLNYSSVSNFTLKSVACMLLCYAIIYGVAKTCKNTYENMERFQFLVATMKTFLKFSLLAFLVILGCLFYAAITGQHIEVGGEMEKILTCSLIVMFELFSIVLVSLFISEKTDVVSPNTVAKLEDHDDEFDF